MLSTADVTRKFFDSDASYRNVREQEQNEGFLCPTFFAIGTNFDLKSQNQSLRKVVVPRGGIEPPTPAFSVQCSTD
jgi:hypothetical protein